jgi:Mechanosensitive ion channel
MRPGRLTPNPRLALLLSASGLLLSIVASASGRAEAADSPASTALSFTPAGVKAALDQTLAWYQRARVAMRAINDAAGPLFAREDEQAVLRVLERAFDAARAQAAILGRQLPAAPAAAAPDQSRQADERGRLEAEIKKNEEESAQLRARLKRSPAAARTALERELAAASNQLELNRLRLDFLTRLGQLDTSVASNDDDLAHQIKAIQDAVPELKSQPGSAPAPAAAALRADDVASGTRALVSRLLALQRARSTLKEMAQSTSVLARDVATAQRGVETVVRANVGRLRELAKDPVPSGKSLDDGAREFRETLDRVKLLSGVALPLREESALLGRFGDDLRETQGAIDRASGQALQGLLLQLVGVGIAIGVICIGAVLWRIAAYRYVTDGYRRRIAMGARNAVVTVAIVLVILFHFTSELTALVTILGFAAAGIAFALQNVILAVAGYFSIVAPNGIRIGDRVSLQGPFGYVHGEVIEIGLFRLRLRELIGEQLAPTGRIVVFPNSVVFTGSFYKHPTPA